MTRARALPAGAAPVVEYVPKAARPAGVEEGEHEAMRQALSAGMHESAADALDLAGSPELLERLEGYPPDHPYRAGIRWKVYYVPAYGRPSFVPVDWQSAGKVPTEGELARFLVASAGRWKPGTYLVRGFLRNRALSKIELDVGAPLEAPTGATGGAGAGEGLALVRELLPALGAGRQADADLSERLADCEESLKRMAAVITKQGQALAELSSFAAQAVQGMGAGGDVGGLLGMARELKELFGERPAAATGGAAPAKSPPEGFFQ